MKVKDRIALGSVLMLGALPAFAQATIDVDLSTAQADIQAAATAIAVVLVLILGIKLVFGMLKR